ncbi:hypothetical protein [Collinsella aerofaciens]|uniref:phage tail protein n=1 Tax=Collinsella aerofaciens TaxID=74426 RepID=UPI00319E5E3B
MDLLDLLVKIGVDDQASGKVDGIAGGIEGKLGKAAAAAASLVAAGVTAVAAGVAAVTGMSMNAYAAYEQNVGCIQKIFGNMGKSLEDYAAMTGQTVEQCSGKWQQLEQAQTTVLANADRAYITAGLSANRYMEQVTGFSASLVSSLGGDTVKAAEYANTAMVDMSDNANTFGTAMEDLQNAYQGFAKQNYTMLDNLKLGYGGTKEEMQRLISDAHAVNSAVDESSLSFDNIVLAIHTMQEQMQIAGTTSREAATTIEGSCNMAKAAWENWVTELGKDDADMGKLTTELVESVETAASNIVPRVATIVSTAVEQLPGVIATLAPVAGEAFMSIADSAMSALSGAFGGLDEIGAQVGPVLYDGIVNGLSFLSGAAADIMSQLGGYLSENLPSIMESGLQILTGLSESIAENAGVLAEGAANLIVGLAQGIADSLPTIIEQAPVIVQNLADAINDNAPTLLGAGIQAIVTLALGIVQAIPTLIANIPAIFSAFVSAWSALDWLSLGRNAITFLGNGITGMAGFVSTCGTNIVSAIRGAIQNLPSTLASIGRNGISSLGSAIRGAVGFVTSAASSIGSSIMGALSSIPGRVVSIGSQIVQGIANGISGAAGVVVSKITGVVGGAIDAAKNLLGIHSPSRVFRKMFGYVMEGAALGIDDTADEPVKSMRSAVRNVEKAAVFGASVTGGGAYGATASGAAGIAGGGNVYNLYLDGDLLGVDGRVASAFRGFVAAVEQSMAMGVA